MSTQYNLTLQAFPIKAAAPITEPGGISGSIVIVGNASNPNITSFLPVGTKFFLRGAGIGISEDPTIVRVCTNAFFDSNNNENIFNFTPPPSIIWSDLAWLVKFISSVPVNLTAAPYTALSNTQLPNIIAINSAIAQATS